MSQETSPHGEGDRSSRDRGDSLRKTVIEPREDERGIGQLEARPAAKDVAGIPGRRRDAEEQGDTVRFRPTSRPPMALLQVLDDGQQSAEVVRIRAASLVIGKAEGDLVIPHDGQISRRHAEISRRVEDGKPQWFLHDLGSTNGTFVMVHHAVLEEGTEILIGRHRLRFEVQSPSPREPKRDMRQTVTWDSPEDEAAPAGGPCLVELVKRQEGRRYPLTAARYGLGRDPGRCQIVLGNDRTVSPLHAIAAREGNVWRMEDQHSLNGLWIRITREIPLGQGAVFLLGEQHFSISLP
jgi:pSer/pThr/pTyr-binding forkhead associated (FHA) protein